MKEGDEDATTSVTPSMSDPTLGDVLAAVSAVAERVYRIEIALTTVADDQALIRERLFETTDGHGKRIHNVEHRLTSLEREKVNGGG